MISDKNLEEEVEWVSTDDENWKEESETDTTLERPISISNKEMELLKEEYKRIRVPFSEIRKEMVEHPIDVSVLETE